MMERQKMQNALVNTIGCGVKSAGHATQDAPGNAMVTVDTYPKRHYVNPFACHLGTYKAFAKNRPHKIFANGLYTLKTLYSPLRLCSLLLLGETVFTLQFSLSAVFCLKLSVTKSFMNIKPCSSITCLTEKCNKHYKHVKKLVVLYCVHIAQLLCTVAQS